MKVLIIFALAVLISCDDVDIDETTISCPDKKIKMGGDVCAITVVGADSTATSYTYVKKKSCGKNQACKKIDDNYNKESKQEDYIYSCVKKASFLKIDDKCNYHAECYTGYCNGGKCAAFGDSDTCSKDRNCGPGKYCDDNKNKCAAYVAEGGSCKNGEKCAPGYGCDKTEQKCIKYLTLEVGDKSNSNELCKSLAAYNDYCIEVVEVDSKDCSLKYKDKDGKEQTVKSDSSNQDLLGDYDNGKFEECYYGYRPQKLKDEIIERFGKIKLDKLTDKKKENCDYGIDHFCDQKFTELWTVYENYDYLLKIGLINENGEKSKDKKCEYEFFISMSSSSYVNIWYGIAFALLGLLF